MMQSERIAPGFANPVLDAHRVFRAAMMALARPGTVHHLVSALQPPQPLTCASGALALALCDNDTPIWLDARLSTEPAVTAFLRFHTGARLLGEPGAAAFAFVADPQNMPSWDKFAVGTLEYPDRSTTLVVQVETLDDTRGWRLTGPGIAGDASLRARPLPADFLVRLAENRRLFPRGIDLFLVAGDRVAALPRTTIVTG
jgi:alpha-D-ribose 1-methylphosphonate 5-triphosphate synthase subunit PhnH